MKFIAETALRKLLNLIKNKMDTKVDQELDVYVGNIKKFTALPGASGDGYAVRVTSIIREE